MGRSLQLGFGHLSSLSVPGVWAGEKGQESPGPSPSLSSGQGQEKVPFLCVCPLFCRCRLGRQLGPDGQEVSSRWALGCGAG